MSDDRRLQALRRIARADPFDALAGEIYLTALRRAGRVAEVRLELIRSDLWERAGPPVTILEVEAFEAFVDAVLSGAKKGNLFAFFRGSIDWMVGLPEFNRRSRRRCAFKATLGPARTTEKIQAWAEALSGDPRELVEGQESTEWSRRRSNCYVDPSVRLERTEHRVFFGRLHEFWEEVFST